MAKVSNCVTQDTKALMQAISFFTSIGITIQLTSDSIPSFLSGVWISDETLFINPRESTVGDVFHEAGHLAVCPSEFRKHISAGDLTDLTEYIDQYFELHSPFDQDFVETSLFRSTLQMGETESIAWSYAAAIAAGIEPESIFSTGFLGAGEHIYSNLKHNCYVGINGLHHGGMCNMREFPKMKLWMQN